MEIVPPTTNINPVNATTDNFSSQEQRQHQLPVDKIIRATVAEGGFDKAVLEFNERLFNVETKVPLSTGQKLTLQVMANSPKLELQIIDDLLKERIGKSLFVLNGKWDFLSMLQGFTREDNPLWGLLSRTTQSTLVEWLIQSQQFAANPDGNTLSFLMQFLGLNLEATLARGEKDGKASLKGSLLEMLKTFEAGKGPLHEEVRHLLQQLELFQLCQLKLNQQHVLFLPLLLPFLNQGYLVAEHKGQASGKDEPAPFKLSLHLDLQGLGNLEVDFLYEPQGVFLRFMCDSIEKRQFMAEFQEELMEMLTAVPLQGVNFATGAGSPAKSLLMKIMTDGNGVLDTRI